MWPRQPVRVRRPSVGWSPPAGAARVCVTEEESACSMPGSSETGSGSTWGLHLGREPVGDPEPEPRASGPIPAPRMGVMAAPTTPTSGLPQTAGSEAASLSQGRGTLPHADPRPLAAGLPQDCQLGARDPRALGGPSRDRRLWAWTPRSSWPRPCGVPSGADGSGAQALSQPQPDAPGQPPAGPEGSQGASHAHWPPRRSHSTSGSGGWTVT